MLPELAGVAEPGLYVMPTGFPGVNDPGYKAAYPSNVVMSSA